MTDAELISALVFLRGEIADNPEPRDHISGKATRIRKEFEEVHAALTLRMGALREVEKRAVAFQSEVAKMMEAHWLKHPAEKVRARGDELQSALEELTYQEGKR